LRIGEHELHERLIVVKVLDPARNLGHTRPLCRFYPVVTGQDLVRAARWPHEQRVLPAEPEPAYLCRDPVHHVFPKLQPRVVRVRYQGGDGEYL